MRARPEAAGDADGGDTIYDSARENYPLAKAASRGFQRCNSLNMPLIVTRLVSLESSRRGLFNDTSLVKIRGILSELERLNVDIVFEYLCNRLPV